MSCEDKYGPTTHYQLVVTCASCSETRRQLETERREFTESTHRVTGLYMNEVGKCSKLDAENKRLRAALEEILCVFGQGDAKEKCRRMYLLACDALRGEG